MPKYVVVASHDPSGCPGASAQMGELFGKLMANGPKIAAKYQVQAGEILHLGPSHRLMFMFEAPSADALNEYLIESRLADVQDVQLYFGEELHGLIEKTERLGLQPLY
ncbi:MAG: hypothetical protein JO352_19130 [Chloroflexi bacterium]|nr:hypothetical protein [Chloroflexota bacterium]MBV9597469.1 hypothetical protein [Chloroflexota bacterium]